APNVIYSGGFDAFDELQPGRYDAFLYTAAFDGLPNVILEAMAAGLPVIAPDVGGIREAVSGETGYLVADDPDVEVLVGNFVEAIRALYADWAEAGERGAKARALVERRHSAEAFTARVAEVFDLPVDSGNNVE